MKTKSKPDHDLTKPQTGKEIKKDMPVKNAMTDETKKAASQTPGLNQAKTKRDDLFPSDGDNLTI